MNARAMEDATPDELRAEGPEPPFERGSPLINALAIGLFVAVFAALLDLFPRWWGERILLAGIATFGYDFVEATVMSARRRHIPLTLAFGSTSLACAWICSLFFLDPESFTAVFVMLTRVVEFLGRHG